MEFIVKSIFTKKILAMWQSDFTTHIVWARMTLGNLVSIRN